MIEELLIIDFGSQFTQLIARRVRELNVYCEIHPFHSIPKITENIKGIILSGSPCSVRDEDSPRIDMGDFRGRIPVLGVCYGAQLLAVENGGNVEASNTREYGRAKISNFEKSNELLQGLEENSEVWMSHGDSITQMPTNAELIISTSAVKVAGFSFRNEKTFGIQFHPEVTHTQFGKLLIKNFVVNICGFNQTYTPTSFVETTVAELKTQLGKDKVVLGLSGGVDSSVAAMLIHKAIGKNLYCIFVDNGLLRKNEFDQVLDSYKGLGLNVIGVNAKDRFYDSLRELKDPELKRKAIGKTFIEVFDYEAHKIEDVKWLAQGTIYPDIIESVSVKGPSVTIKSHHNVGGLPDFMKLKIVEPLKTLFKDGVREVGKTLNMPAHILERHPFPGPGLGIRILGDITAEKVRILQEVDSIFIEGLKNHNLYNEVWQAGAMLLPVQSVGVMGDERTYENVVALRAVTSVDGMTADWAHLPYDF
jgi:GMP synthase (glutamine-hydrolysing)